MKKLKIFISLLLVNLMIIPTAFAIDITDLANADESLKVEKNLFGTSFSAGNDVNITSKIDGISFVAGNTINDSSESDYLFEAGNIVNLTNVKTRDLFVAGNQIIINSSDLKRDVYAASSNFKFEGRIGRNLYVGAESVVINGKIKGNVVINAENITISNNAKIDGILKYNEDANISIAKESNISSIEKTKAIAKEKISKENVSNVLIDLLSSYGNVLIFGLVLMLLMRKAFDKIDAEKLEASNVFKTIGIGFITLIAIPLVSIIAMVTGIGVASGIIILLLYGISIYATSIITSYYFGKKILNSKIDNDYLLFAISLLILKIVIIIPFIGGLVSFASLLFGLGMIYTLIKKSLNKKKQK